MRTPRYNIKSNTTLNSLSKQLSLVFCLVAFAAGSALSQVAAPLKPLVFEKPNSGEIEILWFHPDFHLRTVGNLSGAEPSRYGHPLDNDDQAMIISQFPIQAPFGISRFALNFSITDPEFGNPGDQFTPLDIQLSTSRKTVTSRPTDISAQLVGGVGMTPLVNVPINESFAQGDTLFCGLQWQSGSSTQPMVGIEGGLGGLTAQSYVRYNDTIPVWSESQEFYGKELDVLDWRSRNDGGGAWVADYSAIETKFTVWYAPDTVRPIESAHDWSDVETDRLSWRTSFVGTGFLGIYAVDSALNRSDTVYAPVDVTSLRSLTFSSSQMYFDWKKPNSLSQTLSIQNHTSKTALLTFVSDNPLVVFESEQLSVPGGGAFKFMRASALSAPLAFDTVEAAIYIYNDQGWAPVKMDVYLIPTDIQTGVDDEDASKPISFSVSDVFPNPIRSTSSLRVASERTRSFVVTIYNVLGQELQTSEFQSRGEIDIPIQMESGFDYPTAAGVYFVRISSEGESIMRKFVFLK